jgi:hypothetical protein
MIVRAQIGFAARAIYLSTKDLPHTDFVQTVASLF